MIEGAEGFIISLRRYRNLHPTFSKVHTYSFYIQNLRLNLSFVQQIHKIPRTTCAQGTNELEVDYLLALGRNLSASGGIGQGQGSLPGIYPWAVHSASEVEQD